jgi:hypothetical protein
MYTDFREVNASKRTTPGPVQQENAVLTLSQLKEVTPPPADGKY